MNERNHEVALIRTLHRVHHRTKRVSAQGTNYIILQQKKKTTKKQQKRIDVNPKGIEINQQSNITDLFLC